jgi:hypothetical protein
MKIIIKTLQGKQLPLEVEETDTVSIYTFGKNYYCIGWTSKTQDSSRASNAS